MKRMYQAWQAGLSYLLYECIFSFYVFFTAIFAECAYLFTFCNFSTATLLSAVFVGYIVTILITARYKGRYEGFKQESHVKVASLIVLLILFIVGCIINWKICLLFTLIPPVSTVIIMPLAAAAVLTTFKKIFTLKVNWFIYQLIIIVIPFIAFTVFLSLVPTIPIIFKIVIPIVYLICVPFIAYIEDNFAAGNILDIFLD